MGNSVTTNSFINSENSASAIQFESISMPSPTNLNPSATTFIYGGNIHSDLDNVEMMNNTNAFEMNKECGGTRDAGMLLTSNLNYLDTILSYFQRYLSCR